VPAFLSDTWIASLDDVGRRVPVAVGRSYVFEQRVRDVPGRGEVRYRVEVSPEGLRVRPGAAERPDVTLSTDYAVAVALARGETTAQHVLAAGRLRVGGDVGALVEVSAALRRLGELFDAVRAATTFE